MACLARCVGVLCVSLCVVSVEPVEAMGPWGGAGGRRRAEASVVSLQGEAAPQLGRLG